MQAAGRSKAGHSLTERISFHFELLFSPLGIWECYNQHRGKAAERPHHMICSSCQPAPDSPAGGRRPVVPRRRTGTTRWLRPQWPGPRTLRERETLRTPQDTPAEPTAPAALTSHSQVAEEEPAVDEGLLGVAGLLVHDVQVGGVEAQRGGRQPICHQVHPQQLHRDQGLGQAQDGCQEDTAGKKTRDTKLNKLCEPRFCVM